LGFWVFGFVFVFDSAPFALRNLYEIFEIFADFCHLCVSLLSARMPCVLNEIVIKCFNIEVTKGSREADMAS